MIARKVAIAAASLVVALIVASCSDEEPGEAVDGGQTPTLPNTPGSSAPAESLPHSGAPKVESPIADTSRWEGDPCSLLTADQLSSIGLRAPAGEREDVPAVGPGCYREFDAETVSGFSVSFDSQAAGKGLSNLYKHKELGSAKVFEELPSIEGHPAIVIMLEKDRRAEGSCAVAVGIRDDLTVGVDMTADPSIPQGKDPCGWAAKVAALAVQTMKGSS